MRKEIIQVERGIGKKLAIQYKVSQMCVSLALRGERLSGISKAIRATALESYGGRRKVIIIEDAD